MLIINKMSYFVYFDNNKQSFKFLKAEEGTTLSFNDNQFCIRKNNHIEQVVINGDDNIYTYYIIYSVNTSAGYRASESNCSYRITGYVQFYVDIYEYNDVDWSIIIDDGKKQYYHKVNNKLSPYIIIPINIYSDNLEKITMTSSVPFKTPINNTFINLIVESY